MHINISTTTRLHSFTKGTRTREHELQPKRCTPPVYINNLLSSTSEGLIKPTRWALVCVVA